MDELKTKVHEVVELVFDFFREVKTSVESEFKTDAPLEPATPQEPSQPETPVVEPPVATPEAVTPEGNVAPLEPIAVE